MSFYLLRCRKNQGQFCHFWQTGPKNKYDYLTKHHTAIHNNKIRPDYFTAQKVLDGFRENMKSEWKTSAARVC